jgi:hypothetical protein
MTEFSSPWTKAPAPLPVPPPPGLPWRFRRWWHGVCAVLIAFATAVQVIGDIHVLLTTVPATARVLAPDEPGGSPEPLPLPLPFTLPGAPNAPGLSRLALSFMTVEGQEVTVAVGQTAMPWRRLRPGAEVPIRYNPAEPTAHPELRGVAEILGIILLSLISAWIFVPMAIWVYRGATLSWRTAWPPWPFRR